LVPFHENLGGILWAQNGYQFCSSNKLKITFVDMMGKSKVTGNQNPFNSRKKYRFNPADIDIILRNYLEGDLNEVPSLLYLTTLSNSMEFDENVVTLRSKLNEVKNYASRPIRAVGLYDFGESEWLVYFINCNMGGKVVCWYTDGTGFVHADFEKLFAGMNHCIEFV
jgi:hypothetical protein